MGNGLHKGCGGVIGVVGGSPWYSGAPFFAGMAALRSWADLVYIFCDKSSAVPIKSLSPDLCVFPLLDYEKEASSIDFEGVASAVSKLSLLIVGPGLSLNENLLSQAARLLFWIRSQRCIDVVVDADALTLFGRQKLCFQQGGTTILTPNFREFEQLVKTLGSLQEVVYCDSIFVLEKGEVDYLHQMKDLRVHKEPISGLYNGSIRRCGGQGDILCGVIAAQIAFNRELQIPKSIEVAFKAVRKANELAFEKHGRSFVASDMLALLGTAIAQVRSEVM